MYSQQKDPERPQGETAPSSTPPGGRPRHIAVIDFHAERGTSVERIVGELPGIELSIHGDAARLVVRTDLALFALSQDAAALEVAFAALRRPGGPKIEAIAYGDGADAWPLRLRCRVLLAGAACILDSGRQDFATQLQERVRRWLEAAERSRREEAGLRSVMEGLGVVGQSAALLAVYRWVRKVSPLSDLPVLITGETGTGKELVAQAVWKLDAKRRERPFVAVNCGSVGGELAESEFFGHERGAFTGADQPRAGLFRAAQGGVLFLDEVGELSEVHQAKLLRVLQEGRVRGIGADREVPVDVRVLAATNRDLTERVRQGQFRQDLYQRLHVLHIHLPPLRERPEDIDPLIHRFVSQVGGDPPGVTPEFVHALKQANLPGNVRELENLVRQAIFLRDGDGPLGLADLPRELLSGLALPESTSGTVSSESPLASVGLPDAEALLAEHNWNLARAVSHCEKLLLAAALERTRGNQSEAARLLGITARSVYNKLRRHRRSR